MPLGQNLDRQRSSRESWSIVIRAEQWLVSASDSFWNTLQLYIFGMRTELFSNSEVHMTARFVMNSMSLSSFVWSRKLPTYSTAFLRVGVLLETNFQMPSSSSESKGWKEIGTVTGTGTRFAQSCYRILFAVTCCDLRLPHQLKRGNSVPTFCAVYSRLGIKYQWWTEFTHNVNKINVRVRHQLALRVRIFRSGFAGKCDASTPSECNRQPCICTQWASQCH